MSFEVTLREKITKWRSLLSGLTVSCSILSMLKFLIPNNNVELTNHFSRSILIIYSHKEKKASFDADNDFCQGCGNVSHSYRQQSFSGWIPLGRSDYLVNCCSGSNHCILNTFYLFSNSGKTSGVCFQSSRWPGLTPSHSDSNGSSSKS